MDLTLRILAAGAALVGSLALTSPPARAHHNDWAAPLVGGALGGYALSSIVGAEQQKARAASRPTYVAPASPTYYQPVREYAPVSSSTSSIEARLKQLDQLAAGGYITKEEYQQRRATILDGL